MAPPGGMLPAGQEGASVETTPAAALTVTQQGVLEEVRDVFAVGDDMETIQWLASRPDIASALLASRPAVEDIFGGETRVVLELVHDPEAEKDPGSVFALIQTSLDPAEARPLMDSFRHRWWNNALASIGEGLTFGLAYR